MAPAGGTMFDDRDGLVYGSTKCWQWNVSTAFRQWRANSHCAQLHGYALTFKATFEALELDQTNWVVDFGGFRIFKTWLESMFDHTTVVAKDDPHLELFRDLDRLNVITLREVTQVGCEAFARLAFIELEAFLRHEGYHPRVRLMQVEVSEHPGNSAFIRRR